MAVKIEPWQQWEGFITSLIVVLFNRKPIMDFTVSPFLLFCKADSPIGAACSPNAYSVWLPTACLRADMLYVKSAMHKIPTCNV